MSERRLRDWLSSFLEYCENDEPPLLFKKWTGISVIASALQRRCFVEWEKIIYPNLYIVLIGSSGVRKGTAMEPGYNLVRNEPVIKLSAEATTREALIRKLKKIGDLISYDEDKRVVHSSLTIWSQELTVFLGYKNEQFLTDLTDWYDCKECWTYETKNMGVDEVIGVCVNLIGATTPEMLQHALPPITIGGGLTSRIIFVYGAAKSCINPAPFKTPYQKSLMEDLQYDLSVITQMKGQFVMTEGFLNRRIDWYVKQSTNPPILDPKFWGYLERRPTHQLKVAMAMSASRSNDLVLDEEIFVRSVEWLEECERSMERVYKGYGRKDYAPFMERILHILEMSSTKSVRFVDLLYTFQRDLDTLELKQIIDSYVKIGVVKVQSIDNGRDQLITLLRDTNERPQNSP